MKPLVRGRESALIEIPASWYLDDLPPMMFIKKAPNSHGFMNPRDIEDLWLQQFDWVYRNYDHAVFVMSSILMSPGVLRCWRCWSASARTSWHSTGARFMTNEEIADDFDRRHPFRPKKGQAQGCAACAGFGAAKRIGRAPAQSKIFVATGDDAATSARALRANDGLSIG